MKKFLNILAVGFVMAGAILSSTAFTKKPVLQTGIAKSDNPFVKSYIDDNNSENLLDNNGSTTFYNDGGLLYYQKNGMTDNSTNVVPNWVGEKGDEITFLQHDDVYSGLEFIGLSKCTPDSNGEYHSYVYCWNDDGAVYGKRLFKVFEIKHDKTYGIYGFHIFSKANTSKWQFGLVNAFSFYKSSWGDSFDLDALESLTWSQKVFEYAKAFVKNNKAIYDGSTPVFGNSGTILGSKIFYLNDPVQNQTQIIIYLASDLSGPAGSTHPFHGYRILQYICNDYQDFIDVTNIYVKYHDHGGTSEGVKSFDVDVYNGAMFIDQQEVSFVSDSSDTGGFRYWCVSTINNMWDSQVYTFKTADGADGIWNIINNKSDVGCFRVNNTSYYLNFNLNEITYYACMHNSLYYNVKKMGGNTYYMTNNGVYYSNASNHETLVNNTQYDNDWYNAAMDSYGRIFFLGGEIAYQNVCSDNLTNFQIIKIPHSVTDSISVAGDGISSLVFISDNNWIRHKGWSFARLHINTLIQNINGSGSWKYKNGIASNAHVVITFNPQLMNDKSYINGERAPIAEQAKQQTVKLDDYNGNGVNIIDLSLKSTALFNEYLAIFPNTAKGATSNTIELKINNFSNTPQGSFTVDSGTTNLYKKDLKMAGGQHWNIIQTKSNGGGFLPNLNFSFNPLLSSANNFWATGKITEDGNFVDKSTTHFPDNDIFNKTFLNGIYHLHLDNGYHGTNDYLLEVGKANWQVGGVPNNDNYNYLAQQLNVKLNVKDPQLIDNVDGNLNAYQQYAITAIGSAFDSIVQEVGGGFDYSALKNEVIPSDWSKWTPELNWFNKQTWDGTGGLNSSINYSAVEADIKPLILQAKQKDISDGVDKVAKLATELHVSGAKNVFNKAGLDAYSKYVNDYNSYLQKNVSVLVDKTATSGGYGYLKQSDLTKIDKYFSMNYVVRNDLNNVEWNYQSKDGNFSNNINENKLKNAIGQYITNEFGDEHAKFNADLTKAETGVNYHGYSVGDVLKYGHKALPTDKQEIDNFDGKGDSFHVWLQNEANMLYHNNRNGQTMKTVLISVFSGIGGILLIAFLVWVLKNRFAKVGNYEKNKAWLKAENKKLKPGETPWIDAFADDDGSIKN